MSFKRPQKHSRRLPRHLHTGHRIAGLAHLDGTVWRFLPALSISSGRFPSARLSFSRAARPSAPAHAASYSPLRPLFVVYQLFLVSRARPGPQSRMGHRRGHHHYSGGLTLVFSIPILKTRGALGGRRRAHVGAERHRVAGQRSPP